MASQRTPLPPLPERLRLMTHLLMATMVLSWIVAYVPYPWRFSIIAISAAGVAFAIFALAFSRGVEGTLLLRIVVIMAGGLASMSLLSGLASLFVAPELMELSRCEARAITIQAERQCQADFLEAVEDRLPLPATGR